MSATNCLINADAVPTAMPSVVRLGRIASDREVICNCSVTKENVAGKVYSETDEKVWPVILDC